MKENNIRVSCIAALDEKRGIGKDNKLLFQIPEDFERMRGLTKGHPIVMGRKNFESIGRVLPNKTNIIVTRNIDFEVEGAEVCYSLESGIDLGRKSKGGEEVFIFGGGQIYREALRKNLVDKLYLTLVEGDFGADTFFPEYEKDFKKVIFEKKGKWRGYRYRFLDLERE